MIKKLTYTERMTNRWKDWKTFNLDQPNGWRFVGALTALLLVLPMALATWLERSFTDDAALPILISLAAVTLIAGILVLVSKRLAVTILLFGFSIGNAFAAYITAQMSW